MKNTIKKTAIILIAAIVTFSCSKKDDEPDPRDFQTINFDREEVLNQLPDGLLNSQDPYAQQAVGYVESALNWSDFSGQMTPPDDAVNGGGNSFTWTWNYGGMYVMTLWWEYSDDNTKNYWEIDIQYGDGDRYDYMSAWEYKDGTGGEVLYNYTWICAAEEPESECEDLYWKYTWELDEDNNYIFTYSVESEDDEYENSIMYETRVNDDGSGSLDYYFMDELFYHMEWDAQGNGSWIQYFGDSEISGSWNVDDK